MRTSIVITGLSKALFSEEWLRTRAASRRTDRTPTEAQTRAGNYRKGKVRLHGFTVSIETPAGAWRRGTDANGKPWAVQLAHPYGYINRTEGADGDHVDVIVGPHPEADFAYVVDQTKADGSFDEHKVVLGALSKDEAREIYLSNYSPGWDRIGAITPVSISRFKWWLRNHDVRHPFALSMPEALTKAVDGRPTMSKESVHYRPCAGRKRCCGNCSMFRLHPPDFETGCCTLVKGTIEEDHVCDDWERNADAPKSDEDRRATKRFFRIGHKNRVALDSMSKSIVILGLRKAAGMYREAEVCPHCGAVLEGDPCNSCGKERGGKKVPKKWLRKSAPTQVGSTGTVAYPVARGYSGGSAFRHSRAFPERTAITPDGSSIPHPIIIVGLSKALKQMRMPAGEEYVNPKSGKKIKGGQFAPKQFARSRAAQKQVRSHRGHFVRVVRITGDEISSEKDLKKFQKEAQNYGRTHFANTAVINNDTGKKIRITISGIDHVTSPQRLFRPALASVVALPKMIENAIHRKTSPDKKGRANIKAVHEFSTAIEVDGKLYHAWMTVREDNQGRMYYHHTLWDLDPAKPVMKAVWAPTVREPAEAGSCVLPGEPISNNILPRWIVVVNLRKSVDVADRHTRAMDLHGGNPVLHTLQRRHGEHDGGPTAGRSFWLYPNGRMSRPIPGGSHEEAARGILQAHGIAHGDSAFSATDTLMKHSGAMLLVSHKGGEGAHVHGHPPITRLQAETASGFAERHITQREPVRYTLAGGGKHRECRSIQHMTAESLRQPVSKAVDELTSVVWKGRGDHKGLSVVATTKPYHIHPERGLVDEPKTSFHVHLDGRPYHGPYETREVAIHFAKNPGRMKPTYVSKAIDESPYEPLAKDSYAADAVGGDPAAPVDGGGLDPGLDASDLFGEELQGAI